MSAMSISDIHKSGTSENSKTSTRKCFYIKCGAGISIAIAIICAVMIPLLLKQKDKETTVYSEGSVNHIY